MIAMEQIQTLVTILFTIVCFIVEVLLPPFYKQSYSYSTKSDSDFVINLSYSCIQIVETD